jgi:hypothetical protein
MLEVAGSNDRRATVEGTVAHIRFTALNLTPAVYATLPPDEIDVEIFVDSKGRRDFHPRTVTGRTVSGLVAAFTADGTLVHVGRYSGGKCLQGVYIDPGSNHAYMRQTMTAEYNRDGEVNAISAYSEDDNLSRAAYRPWVIERIRHVAGLESASPGRKARAKKPTFVPKPRSATPKKSGS